MPKFYKRGEPYNDHLGSRALATLQQIVIERDTLFTEFGEFETFVLENGDVELVDSAGDLYRCYVVPDEGGNRLIVDDYHPEEDADIHVDPFGNIVEEYEDDEVPEAPQDIP